MPTRVPPARPPRARAPGAWRARRHHPLAPPRHPLSTTTPTTTTTGARRDDARLRSALAELDRGLAARMGTLELAADALAAADASVAGCPRDELGYCDQLKLAGGRASLDRALAFEAVLQPLVAQLDALPSCARDPSGAAAAVERVGGALDSLWRLRLPPGCAGYPAGRMRRLVELAGAAVSGCAAAAAVAHPLQLDARHPPTGRSGAGALALAALREAASLCGDWVLTVRGFVGAGGAGAGGWASVAWHPWDGGGLEAELEGCERLAGRLVALGDACRLADASAHLARSVAVVGGGGGGGKVAAAAAASDGASLQSAFDALARAVASRGTGGEALLELSPHEWQRLLGEQERALAPLDVAWAHGLRLLMAATAGGGRGGSTSGGGGTGGGAGHGTSTSPAAELLGSLASLLARPAVLKATAPDRAVMLGALSGELDELDNGVLRRARDLPRRLALRSGGGGSSGSSSTWQQPPPTPPESAVLPAGLALGECAAPAAGGGSHTDEVQWARGAAGRGGLSGGPGARAR